MNKLMTFGTALALTAGLACADGGDIKTRQQYMKEFGGLNKKMGRIIKKSNAQTFPAPEFAGLSAQLNQNAREPWRHYGSGSNGKGSEATAAVWDKPQEFQAAIKRFTDATQALDNAAKTGSFESVKVPLGRVGQSCKACHDTFKD